MILRFFRFIDNTWKKSRFFRIACRAFVAGVIAFGAFIAYANYTVRSFSEYVTDDIAKIPDGSTGLVLGTSKNATYGMNLYFKHRIEAAAALYHAGKLRRIIVSGDNSKTTYDEASDMKDELVKRGIPHEIIFRDYAGFRTLDSVVRAKKIFGVEKMVVISQDFHCTRAVYIGRSHDIETIGFAAKSVHFTGEPEKMAIREVLARSAAWIDVNILDRSPKYLGESIDLENGTEQN